MAIIRIRDWAQLVQLSKVDHIGILRSPCSDPNFDTWDTACAGGCNIQQRNDLMVQLVMNKILNRPAAAQAADPAGGSAK